MAKASLYLKCKKCGKEFCHEKYFSNSKERNSYEEWARNAIDLCPDCYKAESREKMREENKKVFSMHLLFQVSISKMERF